MKRLLLGLSVACFSTAAFAAPNVSGNWLTEDKSAIIAIGPCAEQLCGSIAKVLVDRPGAPKTDIHNPDPSLRGRPFIGLRIISGLNPAPTRWEGGRIYDPKSGKSYKSYLQLNGDGSLKVAGCITVFCRSERWTRVR